MNILFLGNFQDKGWDGSITDENHIADALEELGHRVARCQRDHVEFTDGGQWDFTLIAQWDGYTNEVLDTLPKPMVYWAFDYQEWNQEWHCALISRSALYLSKRLADGDHFPNWQYLSQDFAPNFLTIGPDIKRDIDVLFTGSYLSWATERNTTLKAIDEKFNLVIHSVNEWPGFKDVRPPIMDEGLIDLYQRSKINIAIDHTLERGYWSDRVAQIMSCAGFVLCRYVPLMELRFHDYIRYFYNTEDCLSKIDYWLSHDEERESIGNNGWGYPENTVKYRVKDLLTIVENYLQPLNIMVSLRD